MLSGRANALAKAGDGPVEMARMFKLAKSSAIKSRTQAINQLKAVQARVDGTVAEGDVGADSEWPLWVGSARVAVVGELGACVGVGGVSVRSGGGGAPGCRLSH